uniref:Uncharacterized protein n=1 Tax=uncultured prokaryote TaxID=198431 RepID=A0A0H5Q578_9ZZZZ|nr:hypothetical protein [uncultured prokaryote]
MFTGDPEDIVMNSLHFADETLTTEQFALSVPVFMDDFWETIYGTSSTHRTDYIDWPAMKYRVFNLDDVKPRVPVEEPGPFSIGGSDPTVIPTEVAVVASFESQGMPGEVYQRKYNRIYIGALANKAMDPATATSFPVVDPEFQQGIVTAMENLLIALPGPGTLWVQVSNAGGTQRVLPVIGGWVDNSPDTQRRRSVKASNRITWAAS